MARIRTIKPDFWVDEKIGKLKIQERLLFIGLWNISDDQGCFKCSPAYIKGQLFPYDDDLRIDTLKTWIESLINARLIVPFSFNEEGYYFIRTFDDHQKIDRPSKPKFPNSLIDSLKGNTRRILDEGSLLEVVSSNGKEVVGSKVVSSQKTELNDLEIGKTIEFVAIMSGKSLNESELLEYWKAFLLHTSKNYNSENDKVDHFRNWVKGQVHTKKVSTAKVFQP